MVEILGENLLVNAYIEKTNIEKSNILFPTVEITNIGI